MTDTQIVTRTLVVERIMPHSPERIWRALTQSALIGEWLMQNDFQPVVGHRFNFRSPPAPHWNGVLDCEVLVVEPNRRIAYTWNASGEEAKTGIKTTVTWTLAPTSGGTVVRMEQAGFREGTEDRFYQGANYGWQKYFAALEKVAAALS